jgi:hypothetical protein
MTPDIVDEALDLIKQMNASELARLLNSFAAVVRGDDEGGAGVREPVDPSPVPRPPREESA